MDGSLAALRMGQSTKLNQIADSRSTSTGFSTVRSALSTCGQLLDSRIAHAKKSLARLITDREIGQNYRLLNLAHFCQEPLDMRQCQIASESSFDMIETREGNKGRIRYDLRALLGTSVDGIVIASKKQARCGNHR